MGQGYQCGMLWGAALAAGAQAHRLFGPGPQAESAALMAAQRLVESFRSSNKEINCAEITELNWKAPSKSQVLKFVVKGGPIGCFRMAARYAPLAFKEINLAFSEQPTAAAVPPVSCASMLARKMDVSEPHVVMAAGLAGGIGLSGGACGALGAAIWITGLKSGKRSAPQNLYDDPLAQAAIERYLESADYVFECSAIVGRKFVDIHDHASFLRQGGCSKIIEALAAA
jgi:hypothetical protein